MRDYNDTTDYPIVLQTATQSGEMYLTPIVRELEARGIRAEGLPFAVDKAILRAWRECGYTN